MDFLLLRTFSLLWLIGGLTATVVLIGLRRAQGEAAYKPWLIASYRAQLLWNAMGFFNASLHPDLIEPILPFTSILYDIGFYLFIVANTQLAYLFPIGLFNQERKWVLRLSIGLGLLFTGVLIWNNFYPHPEGWSFRGFANILASLFNALITGFGLVTYLRKIRYFQQQNPSMVMPCLLLAGVAVISLGTAFLFVYLGSAHPFVWVFYLFVSTPLVQYMNFILIMYSVFPIRFQDKLIGFAFVSIMTVLLYTNLLLIPSSQTVAARIAHQPELRTLALIIIGSAVFVLWVFPLMLRVSLVRPLEKLLAGIQRADTGDLAVQVPVGTLDEIGMLTHKFNQMTHSLKQSKDELTQYAQTLEEKVDDRTAQLQQSLTDLKAAQAQLIQSEKMASLGELTAGIAHEIQNPLNFVNNFAEVSVELAEELVESVQTGNTSAVVARSADLMQNMHYIAENGHRASAIIRSMLEHSRSSSGERVPTDLNALAEEYLKLAYHGMRAKDSDFTAKLDMVADPDLGLVDVIPQDIGRVLLNLFNNAFYAVQEQSARSRQQGVAYQPCVEVSTQRQKGQAIIRVKDNGIGISASIQEKIFQPFFTTKPTGQGTGLGLSLSYDIVTKGHGGNLAVENTENQGSQFIITLPDSSSSANQTNALDFSGKRLFMKLFMLVSMLIVGKAAFAQTKHDFDSLRHQLAMPQQDTSRVLLMTQLAYSYRISSPDSSLLFARQALQLAQRINYAKGEGRALTNLGFHLNDRGESGALDYLFRALKLNRATQDSRGEGLTLNYIGLTFINLNEHRQAINYFNQAKRTYEAISDQDGVINVLANMGSVYLRLNQLDSAQLTQQKAYNLIRQQATRSRFEAMTLRNLGMIQARLGNANQALRYYREALKSTYGNNDIRMRGAIQYRIAELFSQLHQPDSSLYYARISFVTCQKVSYLIYIKDITNLLTKLYQAKDNFDSAFYFQSVATAAKDSLYGPDKFQRLQLLMLAEQTEQQALVESQKDYQNNVRFYALLGGLGVALLLAFMLYRNNHQKQKANNLLHHQKEEIDAQRTKAEKALTDLQAAQTQLIQKEKMASLGELTAGIAHEIQNPLNFVNNFAEVSIELADELGDSVQSGHTTTAVNLSVDLMQNMRYIAENGQRASAIVRSMLEHSRTSTGERVPTDLNALAEEYLKLAYHGMRAKDSDFIAKLDIRVDPDLSLVEVISQDIGRVLLNLYNNAFYAVHEQGARNRQQGVAYQPCIEVSTQRQKGQAIIRVKDNGIGIPASIQEKIFQPFFTTKPTGQGTGLGLSLSYDIITKGHNGEMHVESQPGKCTEFILSLPLHSSTGRV